MLAICWRFSFESLAVLHSPGNLDRDLCLPGVTFCGQQTPRGHSCFWKWLLLHWPQSNRSKVTCVPNLRWEPLHATGSSSLLRHQLGLRLRSLIDRHHTMRRNLHTLQFGLSPVPFPPLPLLGCGLGLAGATLLDGGGGRFGGDYNGHFARRHPRVLANVDGEVGVERLQLSGQQLVGEGVETVRAPVEPGPFQEVKPGRVKLASKGW